MQTVSSMNEQPGYSIVLNQFITKKRLCTLYGTVVASMRSMRSSMGGSNKNEETCVARRAAGVRLRAGVHRSPHAGRVQ
jgi:hypothetical protein